MQTNASAREKERMSEFGGLLYHASRPLRILSTLAWAPQVRERFLASGARELPEVTYTPFDPAPSIEAVREARRRTVPVTTIDLWLDRQADAIECGARMLAAAGTPSFYEYGRQIYGEPTAPLRYLPITPLDLAQNVHDTIAQVAIPIASPTYHSAETVAENLTRAVAAHFGEQAPAVELVDELSSNALATARAIRIRRGARFTDRDFTQLLHHEAYIHVATAWISRHSASSTRLVCAGPRAFSRPGSATRAICSRSSPSRSSAIA